LPDADHGEPRAAASQARRRGEPTLASWNANPDYSTMLIARPDISPSPRTSIPTRFANLGPLRPLAKAGVRGGDEGGADEAMGEPPAAPYSTAASPAAQLVRAAAVMVVVDAAIGEPARLNMQHDGLRRTGLRPDRPWPSRGMAAL
jgi:hypothetical protein